MSKWTKEQEEAIYKYGSNIIVSAGAGSGKTAVLTERTIQKLLNGTDINRLLILTFTNAAAGEMKERIRKAIKKNNLNDQLDKLDSAYITTFDSFALSTVKKYHYLLKIPANVSIMDNSIEILKTKEIIDFIFEEKYGDLEFEKLINDFCSKSDEKIKNVVVELSKKLDLLLDKKTFLNNYIDTHYDLKSIDEIVNKYLNNIIEVKNTIFNPYDELKSRVDDKYLEVFNLEPLLDSNSYDEVKESLTKIGSPRKNSNCEEDFKIYKDKITKIIKDLSVLTRFENVKEIKETLLMTKSYVKVICDIILEYDLLFMEYKKSNNLYTFNDIAKMAINLIKENEEVKIELINNFDEIMVDEYQDTSDIQEAFISLISNNNVYMVGDIKQSIYRFRHANPNIFREKYNNYSNNFGGIKIDLLKNFRSRMEVLDNINLIFNLIMTEDLGDADYITSHQMNFGNMSYLENVDKNQNNNMEIFTYSKSEEYTNDEIEAFYVANDIKEKVNNLYKIVDKETNKLRNCKYSDFAIIMDRGTTFDLYKKVFEYVGVPLVQIKNEKLTSSDDVISICNLISLIVKINLKEYDDEFKYLFVSVSRSYIYKTLDEEIYDSIKNIFNTELFKICQSINIFEISSLDLINEIISKFNLYEKIITIKNINDAMIKLDYLKDLSINLSNVGYTPIMFSEYLKKMIKENNIEYSLNSDSTNSVKILNIHKSKGLEYSVCYFTGLYKKINDDEFKDKFIVDSSYNIIVPYVLDGIKETILKDLLKTNEIRNNISEKIRLFYVALTRAKEKIIIVTPLDSEKENYNKIVPYDVRINYKHISEMLESIYIVLTPYIKQIDLDKVNITHDYEKNINKNFKIKKIDKKILHKFNNIDYELLNNSKYSKKVNKILSKEEVNNMTKGIQFHKIFEMENFKNTENPLVLKFLNLIDNNYINIYKEFEFIYEEENELKNGIIDLILEYEDHIDIIDYKTKNVIDDNYVNQVNGYKKYIQTISNKKINTYLYSIIDNELVKI